MARRPRLEDYSDLGPGQRALARKLSSPMLDGPPVGDEFVALVRHLFTEEEAALARHLGRFVGRTVEDLARAEGVTPEAARGAVERLAREKLCIMAGGLGAARTYHLLPLFPDVFELVFIGKTPETLTEWHRRFAELYEALFLTGFPGALASEAAPVLRWVPARAALQGRPQALPLAGLEPWLDRYESFGVGSCQCRLAAHALGRGCGRLLAACVETGDMAERGVAGGWLRRVSRQDVLSIKAEAEAQGLVTFVLNVESSSGQCTCSCCGCCCRAMRLVRDLSAPRLWAPPAWEPVVDGGRCTACGACAKRCPMAALVPQASGPPRVDRARCIGCGQCVVACGSRAVAVLPVAGAPGPFRSWLTLGARVVPGRVGSAVRRWWTGD